MAVFTPTRVFSALIFGAIVMPIVANAAEPAYDSQISVVSTHGVDVTKPADQAVLRHRIAVAAHRVCGQVTQSDSLTSPAYTDCVGRATADAKPQLDLQVASANSQAVVASIAQ